MVSPFEKLPAELLLKIGRHLQGCDNDNDSIDKQGEHGLRPLERQLELSNSEIRYPGAESLRNLSHACSVFYEFLSQLTFHTVTLRNTVKSGEAVRYLSNTAQAAKIKTLVFEGHSYVLTSHKKYRNVEDVFPKSVQLILSNLAVFPKLSKIIIDLDYHLDDHIDLDAPRNQQYVMNHLVYLERVYDEPETKEEILAAEKKDTWRALQAKTFAALAQNTTSEELTRLEVRFYPLRFSPVFGTATLNRWLNGFKIFTFIVSGAANTVWMRATMSAYWYSMRFFDKFFLEGLKNVEKFTFVGNNDRCISGMDGCKLLLSSMPDVLPKLQKLHLGKYSLNKDLIDFLCDHSATLKHIVLSKCYAQAFMPDLEDHPPGYADVIEYLDLSWARFFDQYASRRPTAIESISFEPKHGPIPHYWGYGHQKEDGISAEHSFVEHMGESSESGDERIVFRYGSFEHQDHEAFCDEPYINRKAFEEGTDHRAWQALKKLMRDNKKRNSNTCV